MRVALFRRKLYYFDGIYTISHSFLLYPPPSPPLFRRSLPSSSSTFYCTLHLHVPHRRGHPLKCSAATSSPSSAPTFAVVKGASGVKFGSGSCSRNPSRDAEGDKFAEAAKKVNLVPLYECIISNHLTLVLAYRYLIKEDDKESPNFLFESVHQDSYGINNEVTTAWWGLIQR